MEHQHHNKSNQFNDQQLDKKLVQYFEKSNYLNNNYLLKIIISQNSTKIAVPLILNDPAFPKVDFQRIDERLKRMTDKIIHFDPVQFQITPLFNLWRNVVHIYGIKGDKLEKFKNEILKPFDSQFPNDKQYEIHSDQDNLYIGVLDSEKEAQKLFNYLFPLQFEENRLDLQMCDELTIKRLQTNTAIPQFYPSQVGYPAPFFKHPNPVVQTYYNPNQNKEHHGKSNYNQSNENQQFHGHGDHSHKKTRKNYHKTPQQTNNEFKGGKEADFPALVNPQDQKEDTK